MFVFVIGRGFYGQTQNRALYEASGGQNETLERDVVCCFKQVLVVKGTQLVYFCII
jgi:hypothetical protein